jgi:hypothetical protein
MKKSLIAEDAEKTQREKKKRDGITYDSIHVIL